MPADNDARSIGSDEEETPTVSLPMNYTNMPSSRNQEDDEAENHLKRVFVDLCNACRAGDFEVVDSLLSTPNLDINQVDEWDYSPLILSSLCGHLKIVELLLSRGAVCDRDTFQGARCIYGALNDTIRDLLISFDVSKAVDSSQPFASHLASLLGTLSQIPKDIAFHFPQVHGSLVRDLKCFRLNRFLLSARSAYFKEKLAGPWKYKSIIDMPSSSDPVAFKIVVDYLYLRTDSLPIDQSSTRDQLYKYAVKLKLADLKEGIDQIKNVKDDKERAKIKHDLAIKFVGNARRDLDLFLRESIIDHKHSMGLDLSEEIELEDIDASSHITENLKSQLLEAPSIPDIILSSIDADSESVVFFPANKAVLCRSEYFDTMFKSSMFSNEQDELPMIRDYDKTGNIDIIDRTLVDPSHIPVIQISSSISRVEVMEMVLSFLYHDDIAKIPLMSTIELLFAADELLLERLKTMCAVNITSKFGKFNLDQFKLLQESTGYNVYELVRVSWHTRSDKLEQHMTKMIAYNLAYIYGHQEERTLLLELVSESAARIKQRQDTDTIELIDDIRYYLSKKYSVNDEFSDFYPVDAQFREDDANFTGTDNIKVMDKAWGDYDRDINMIDGLLDELQLTA